MAILKFHGPGVGFKAGILAQVTNSRDRHGIHIKSLWTAQTAITILLARDHLDAAYAALSEHHLAGVVEVSRKAEAAKISLLFTQVK